MTEIDREYAVQQAADGLFRTNPDWVTFYREILGLRGAIRRNYPTLEMLCEFETTETYRQVQQMLKKLRECRPFKPSEEETGQGRAAGEGGGEKARRADARDHGPHSAVAPRCPSQWRPTSTTRA